MVHKLQWIEFFSVSFSVSAATHQMTQLHSNLLTNECTKSLLTFPYFCSTPTCFDTLASSSMSSS